MKSRMKAESRHRCVRGLLGTAVLLATMLSCSSVSGDNWRTDNVLEPGDHLPLSGRVADLNWLAGHWVGEGLGGRAEYHFAPPSSGTIVATFKHARDNEVNFYEILIFAEFDDRTAVRLKHFHPDLTSWEAADAWIEFPLLRLEPGRAAYFDGLTYRLDDDGTLHAHVIVSVSDDQPERELTFRFRRAADCLFRTSSVWR